MNKNSLKGILNKEGMPKHIQAELLKLWDTILMWSGCDGFYTISEIAEKLDIAESTVYFRVDRFKELFPEAYKKLKEDRDAIKSTTSRLYGHGLSSVSYNPDKHDDYVIEKF